MRRCYLFYLVFFLVGLFLASNLFAQKKQKKPTPTYKAVENATPETAFPIAKVLFGNTISIASFDFFNGELISTFYNYSALFAQKRALIRLKIDENKNMDVFLFGIEKYDNTLGAWLSASASIFGPEELERIKIADLFRNALADTAKITKAQKNFFQDLDVNSIFYSKASELAGERWFENYLKDNNVLLSSDQFSVSVIKGQ
ncbi:MAG: hypothetical protein KA713_00785 [Chryseotalea sp. WA131a]|nr:MAG: hypothetical protein KA713_00785 [Chryseotalea sp. WA131a]